MEAQFSNNGGRCEAEGCHQPTEDYMLFTCDKCSKRFCEEHRLCSRHDCANAVDRSIPVCPLCSAPVPQKPGQDVNAAVEAHIAGGCTRSATVPNSRPCAVKGCTETHPVRLGCSMCKQHFCVKHRLPEEHACPVPVEKDKLPDPKTRRALRGLLQSLYKGAGTSNVGPKNVHMDDRVEFAVYFPQCLGIKHQKMFMPRRWSVGKVVDWICEHFKIPNTVQKRHRLITATPTTLSALPNHMTLSQSGAQRDDGSRFPDLAEGVVLIPEEWLSSPPVSPPSSPTEAPVPPPPAFGGSCGAEERLLELLRREMVRCGAL